MKYIYILVTALTYITLVSLDTLFFFSFSLFLFFSFSFFLLLFIFVDHKKTELSEQALIRDVVYTFQGIDGTYVRWSDRQNGKKFFKPTLPDSIFSF